MSTGAAVADDVQRLGAAKKLPLWSMANHNLNGEVFVCLDLYVEIEENFGGVVLFACCFFFDEKTAERTSG
jgi:hypothetical protein